MSNAGRHSLLLLTPPPNRVDRASVKAAYQPAITAALCNLAELRPNPIAVLDIAVPCPGLAGQINRPRAQLFREIEHLLAELYGLLSTISALNNIELDSPGGIDARVLLLEYDTSTPAAEAKPAPATTTSTCGPIVDLSLFALTRKDWQRIYVVESEQGQDVFKRYSAMANARTASLRGQVHKVPGGIVLASQCSKATDGAPNASASKHAVVAVGGTFDHLHSGHKLLLTATALMLQPSVGPDSVPRRLIVGITGDELLKNKKYAEHLESWKLREESVVNFLIPLLSFTLSGDDDVKRTHVDEPVVNGKGVYTKLKQANVTIECVEIQDPFGPTITDEAVSALVVSGETRDGGAAVNTKRQEQGWKSLEVFEIDVLDATDDAESATKTENFAAKISSTAIRRRRAEATQKPSL